MYESEHLPRSLQEHKCPLGKKDYGSEPINRNVNKMIVLSMNKTYNHVINVDKKSYIDVFSELSTSPKTSSQASELR